MQSSPVPGRGPAVESERALPGALPLGGRAHRRRAAGRARAVLHAAAAASPRARTTSLNLGRLTDDDPANVDANRDRLAAAVGVPRTASCSASRSTARRCAARPATDAPVAEEDGQATALARRRRARVRGRLPPGPAGRRRRGRRAALRLARRSRAGIVAEGVAALRELGVDGPITAAIGPGARGCCYEVGGGGPRRVRGTSPAPARASATSTSPRSPATRWPRPASTTVHDTGLCTMCDDRFFSHRRDGGVTGRQAGVVWRA